MLDLGVTVYDFALGKFFHRPLTNRIEKCTVISFSFFSEFSRCGESLSLFFLSRIQKIFLLNLQDFQKVSEKF